MLWREADVSTAGELGNTRAMFWLVYTIIENFSGILEYEDLTRQAQKMDDVGRKTVENIWTRPTYTTPNTKHTTEIKYTIYIRMSFQGVLCYHVKILT